MTLPNAEELEILEHLLGRIARTRQAGVKFGRPGPYRVRITPRTARTVETAIANRNLFPTETTERPDIGDGERWIAFVDGVHVVEVVES